MHHGFLRVLSNSYAKGYFPLSRVQIHSSAYVWSAALSFFDRKFACLSWQQQSNKNCSLYITKTYDKTIGELDNAHWENFDKNCPGQKLIRNSNLNAINLKC